MPAIVHFEIPATILERARYFYSKVFGWEMNRLEDVDYYIVKAKEDEEGINGGIILRRFKEQQFMNYIKVPKIDDFIDRVEQFGGNIILKKTAIPGTGWIAAFRDTENNVVGLWQDDPNAAVEPRPRPME